MQVKFHTNLDYCHKEIWPELDSPPPIGSLIVSSNGTCLKVISNTYYKSKINHQTTVEVELHLPNGETILQWETRMKELGFRR